MTPEQLPSADLMEQARIATFAGACLRPVERKIIFSTIQDGLPREFSNEYQRWCASARPSSAEEVAAKARLLGEYERFRDPVDETLDRIKRGDPTIRSLGTGGKAYVFEMPVGEENYALRLVAPPPKLEHSGDQVNRYASNMYRAIGIPRTEQLAAINFGKPITISGVKPGTESSIALSGEQPRRTPIEHIEELVDTLARLYNGNMATDFNPANTLYDPEHGFSCIDLGTVRIKNLAGAIGYSLGFLFGQIQPGAPEADYDGRIYLLDQARQVVRARFDRTLAERIDETLLQAQAGLRHHQYQGSSCHYYANARAEAEARFGKNRPSVQEWLGKYSVRATQTGYNAPVSEESGTPSLALIRDQLNIVCELLSQPKASLDTSSLDQAIAIIESALRGGSNLNDVMTPRSLALAREQLQAALDHSGRARSSIIDYMTRIGLDPAK
ncbi:MAG TPA: hypothetical protein VMR45_05805 [Patescibacteria group bacterium]|nr:hypothetical protein [Patescibacteria group bacterium]